MAEATLTLTDDPVTGKVDMTVEFGDAFDKSSQAHAMISVLVESVLNSANSYQQIEDTAPEVNVEPSKIITPH